MLSSSSSTSLFLLTLILSCFLHSSHSKKSILLPLKAQKLALSSSSRQQPPNRLKFHHNITLTVTLAVGSPPQNLSMVLDTGSELSWLSCNSTDPATSSSHFNPSLSSSFSRIPCSSAACRSQTRDLPIPASCVNSSCHVILSYADASSSEGSLSLDSFLIGQSQPFRTIFGCMDAVYSSTSSSDGPTAAAGLLGMNRGSLSFVTQTDTKRFSYCISDQDESGLLLIGEPDPAFLVPLNYTPLIQMSTPLPYFDRVAYSVNLERIEVGSVLLPIPKWVLEPDHTGAGQTMVDSGTQFTFLLGPAYEVLKAEFLRQTKGVLEAVEDPDYVFQGAFDACFKGGARGMEGVRLPEVGMVFRGGAEVRVGGGRLLYRVGDGNWCLTFGNSELVGMEAYVIGHHHQVDVWVEYDLEKARVGFGRVRCDWAGQKLGLGL